MANNKLLGCWGFIVGAMAVVVVGWMAFELLIASLAGLRLEGISALVEPLLLHRAGELLVVGFSILGIYVWVFRGPGLAHFAATTRYVFWLGAALNLVAWLTFPAGSRWSWWAVFLVVLGVLGPIVLARLEPTSAELPPDL
jgi:hypothetical protein